MMRTTKIIALIFTILMINVINAQYFGMNKVQYRNFNWRYLQSEHFDVYFYEGGYDIARFTAEVAESAYVEVKNDFQYEISKRVALIVFNSHNDFQQNNVTYSYMVEGIVGVTELYKNRVVVPYDGNYRLFRHTLHHEIVHAVMNDMLYGGSVQSLIAGQVAPVPGWFAEGLAEYGSVRWNTEIDMVVRDATITGYLPPIEFLDYFPYQGGASVFRYIAQKYGQQKVGEIINKVKGTFNFESAFKSALGINFKDLTDEWHRQMKREYWPDIADRKEPGEIAKALTYDREKRIYYNGSPALSPQGDKMVFLSSMEGKISVYLMDVLEGKVIRKLIKGYTSEDFEEMHLLAPGFGWSPDGKNISLSAKAGEEDALYIYNIESDETAQYKFELDGIFETSWSPRGDEIAFIGNKNGASDIYIFSIESKNITNITNDVFSDKNPSWSSDGQRIVFTSDRGGYIEERISPNDFDMHKHNYNNDDIYIINRDGSELIRVTDFSTKEYSPLFTPDGTTLAYISEQNGISNIYLHNLETDEIWPVTNLLTGASQLSWDYKAQKLAFTSFYRGGWHIYLLKNPLELEEKKLELTEYFKRIESGTNIASSNIAKDSNDEQISEKIEKPPNVGDYRKYVFADLSKKRPKKIEKITLAESDYKLANGDYKINKYKIKFTPDLINGAAGYNTFYGLQGYTQISLSDMLGNHRISIGTNLVFDLRNSSISVQYLYLPNRTDYGFGAYHISNFFQTNNGLIRFRNYGLSLLVSRPFTKFTRVDLDLTWNNVNLEYLSRSDIPDQKIQTMLPSITFVNDQIDWGMTGPADGTRWSISALISPKYSRESLNFQTLKADFRRYFKLWNIYSLAFRFYGGKSTGRNPQNFYMGGVSNWINRDFKDGALRVNSIEDVFFSEFVTPLRGARFYEQTGHNFGLLNFEFRFPLIPYMELGFPPLRLGNIQGAYFTDIGSAWDNTSQWRGVYRDDKNRKRMKDLIYGHGLGARIFFFGFLLRFDVAWKYDIASTSKPTYYWSLGADF